MLCALSATRLTQYKAGKERGQYTPILSHAKPKIIEHRKHHCVKLPERSVFAKRSCEGDW